MDVSPRPTYNNNVENPYAYGNILRVNDDVKKPTP